MIVFLISVLNMYGRSLIIKLLSLLINQYLQTRIYPTQYTTPYTITNNNCIVLYIVTMLTCKLYSC